MLEPVSSSDVSASHAMANVELELDQLFCHFSLPSEKIKYQARKKRRISENLFSKINLLCMQSFEAVSGPYGFLK